MADFLLLEDGDQILLEDGDFLLLEEQAPFVPGDPTPGGTVYVRNTVTVSVINAVTVHPGG